MQDAHSQFSNQTFRSPLTTQCSLVVARPLQKARHEALAQLERISVVSVSTLRSLVNGFRNLERLHGPYCILMMSVTQDKI